MPPAIKTDRAAIIEAAVEIIEAEGSSAVSARRVAKRLGISTQPIYREFSDMEELMKEALKRGYEIFANFIDGEALEQSVKYVGFAVEHKNLFNYLFRSRRCKYDGLCDMAHKLVDGTAIIEKLCGITGLDAETVYRLHLFDWMALHGLATMAADNEVKLSREEIAEFTETLTKALTAHFKGAK